MQTEPYVAYCGPAPVPESLWLAWNFDPFVLGAMAAGLAIWWSCGRRDRVGRNSLGSGYGLIFVAFISPLCALSVALFSARVAHHVILIAAIAPLLAIAFPWRGGPSLPLSALVILHAAIVWIWHAPDPYAFALSSHAAYWLMQATLFGSAWLLWREVFAPKTPIGSLVMALLATIMQMGFLGALLVFAPSPVFAAHYFTTEVFGLTPLEDQQLAGLLMWVPAFLPYAGVALYKFAIVLSSERTSHQSR